MRIKYIDNEAVYSRLNYVDGSFFITDGSAENEIECKPQLSVIKEYNPSDFELYFLHNERDDYSENSIFQVKVKEAEKNERIGWIFPLQALLSAEHDEANNQHFLKYAYVAYFRLLDLVEKGDEDGILQPSAISLTDFYQENTVLLLLDKTNISKLKQFCLDEYTVDLYRKGYSFIGKGNLISQNVEAQDSSLNLKKISSGLKDFPIINEIFKNSIPREYDIEFARFYAYYQVVEILISAVFNSKFNEFVKKIKDKTSDLFDDREDLNVMVNEKHRVKWLMGEYTSISSANLVVLDDNCKKMLSAYGKKIFETTAENFYAVRCLLVHELYNVKSDTDSVLKELNNILLEILLEMLFSFKQEN